MKKPSLVIFFLLFIYITAGSQRTLTVHADKPTAAVSPHMWGIFFEDINFAADGGLYAELVKNRSFEFPLPMMGWREWKQSGTGKILIINEAARSTNKRFARVTVTDGSYGLSNEGFRGMGIHAGKNYNLSFLARTDDASLRIRFQLINNSGKTIAETTVQGIGKDWQSHRAVLHTSDTAQKGRLQIWFEGKGSIDIDMISLFPEDTWKNRPNGLRADLVQWLADLKPGFIRFPGGCIVEGRDLSNRYQWKKTVGNPIDRQLIMNRWNVEFRHKLTPDYFQSFGLGFYEYFLLSEDLGAEPLPILNCGMACQYNSGEVASMDDLDPYIQDALDLIAFANGDQSTEWGKLRAAMGHPQPFNMKFLGIGNEQWDEQYIERYRAFEKVLKEKHPEIQLISGAGPSPDGKLFDYAWKELKQTQTALVDEHYYRDPNWFFNNVTRYDKYDRSGPKVFAGEYAAHTKEEAQAESRNNWGSAMAEAAFMTGLERNADLVQMASYAPLLAHVEAWQWRPDLIWFDNLRSVGTPNYYVQKLFANHKGTHVVPLLMDGQPLTGKDSLYASAVIDREKNEIIIKLVNASPVSNQVSIDPGKKIAQQQATLITLTSTSKDHFNTLDKPSVIVPVEGTAPIKQSRLNLDLPPYSLVVATIKIK